MMEKAKGQTLAESQWLVQTGSYVHRAITPELDLSKGVTK